MEVFNGVELMISDVVSFNLAGVACLQGLGSWNLEDCEYFSGMFPLHLQDPKIPIHVKEFWCVIVSVKIWGPRWSGQKVNIYCDNDAVCDVITYCKPKDSNMQSLLREFLHWVCTFNFHPVVSKIGTKENSVADFLSRNYSPEDAISYFNKNNMSVMKNIPLTDSLLVLWADW